MIPMMMPVILVWIVDTRVRAVRVIINRVVATRVIAIRIIAIRVAIWIGINISHLIPLRVGWNDIHC